jgi:hypothetical protein
VPEAVTSPSGGRNETNFMPEECISAAHPGASSTGRP